MLPKDPMILLSWVNTRLRDEYASLDALCEDHAGDVRQLCDRDDVDIAHDRHPCVAAHGAAHDPAEQVARVASGHFARAVVEMMHGQAGRFYKMIYCKSHRRYPFAGTGSAGPEEIVVFKFVSY